MVTDFRRLVGVSVYEIDKTVCFAEAWNLWQGIMKLPESLTAAALHKLNKPWSFEEMRLIELWNQQLGMNTPKGKSPKFIPYPWEDKTKESKQIIGKATMSLAKARELYVNERRDFTPEEAAALNKVFLEQTDQTITKG